MMIEPGTRCSQQLNVVETSRRTQDERSQDYRGGTHSRL